MNKTTNLTKEELIKEGNTKGLQFNEWNGIFDLLRYVRKYQLSELEAFCILSNRYKVEERKLQILNKNG